VKSMPWMNRVARLGTTIALVSAYGIACGPPDDQRTDSVDPVAAMQDRDNWEPGMAAQLDSGNAAVRADSFELARRHFLAATDMAPDVAAGWFGLYLAEQGLGRGDEAMAALERAREIASGASLIHPTERDTMP
jgi:Flp pilus assembly protein TadD